MVNHQNFVAQSDRGKSMRDDYRHPVFQQILQGILDNQFL
jgi:hypothetical protein